MRKHFSKIVTGLVCVAALLATSAASAETKIATIRFDYVVLLSPQYKAGQDQMKTEFEKRKNDLESEGKKLADDYRRLQKEVDLMSADARAKAEKDFNTRKIDIDYKQRQFNEDASKRDRELTETMQKKIVATIDAVAKEKGISVILRDPVYVDSASGIDVTDEVLKRLGGPVQPPAGAKAPAKK